MATMTDHVRDYLRLRRALGFELRFEGLVLPQFVAYLEAAGAATITAELAIAWAQIPVGVHPVTWTNRLGAVRGFATYLRTVDPETQIPPRGVFPGQAKRPTPYIYTDTDITGLLEACRTLRPPLRAATYETLFGLLAVSGMRVGEAIALSGSEVDLPAGVLTISDSKSRSARLLPLHPCTVEALSAYTRVRDRHHRAAATFFVSTKGTALRVKTVDATFARLATAIGLRTATVKPRIHDLRHSFAVRALLGWYRDGEDVATRMPVLSSYLGHTSPAGTYWYMSAVPELMGLAADRLAARDGSRP
jgi:integrase/recombinase XerD